MNDDYSENPKISVIMPCYNTAKYTGITLDSILNQSFRDYEIICIDDGSTDNTGEVLKEYQKRDARIHVYTDENHGQGYQRNVGLQRAKGKYVYFMDSDDKLDSNCFEILYSHAEENMLDVLYFEADAFYESEELEQSFPQYKTLYHRNQKYTEIYSGENLFVKYMQAGKFIVSPCLQLIRRDHLVENRIGFPKLSCLEDNLYTVQVLLCAERAGCISDTLYFRRLRADSVMTKLLDKKRFDSYYKVLLGFFKMLSLYKEQSDVQRAIGRLIGIICTNLNKDYCRLTEEQRLTYFSPDNSEELYFMIMMQQSYDIEKTRWIERQKTAEDKNKTLCKEQAKLNEKLQSVYKEKSELKEKLQQTYREKSELKEKLQQTYREKAELKEKLQQTYQEKSKLNEKLQQTYQEKSELNAKLQQTYREKAEHGEELKELKSHFLVRVDGKLRGKIGKKSNT